MFHPAFSGFQAQRSLQKETVAFLARCSTRFGFFDILAYDTFFQQLKLIPAGETVSPLAALQVGGAAGIWLLAGPTYAQAAYLNLLSASYPCTVNGAVAFTARGGVKGDGNAAYLATGYPLTGTQAFTQNNGFMGVYIMPGSAAEATFTCGGGTSTSYAAIRAYNGSNVGVQGNDNNVDVLNVSAASGFSAWSRTTSAGITIFRDGAASALKTRASVAVPSGSFDILRRGTSYSGTLRVAAALIGGGLTNNQYFAVNNALATLLTSLGVIDPYVNADPPPSGTAYMTKAMSAKLTFKVWQNFAAPASDTVDETTFAGYPLTDIATQQSPVASTWSGPKWQFPWGMRGLGGFNAKPNPTPIAITTSAGALCRYTFSTRAKAKAATRVQTLQSAGAPATNSSGTGYQDIAIAAGFASTDILNWADVTASQSAIDATFSGSSPAGNYAVTLDKIVLLPWRLADVPVNAQGFALDMEFQDDTTEAELIAFVTAYAADCHQYGFKVFFYMDPYNSTVQSVHTGITANSLQTIQTVCDFFGMTISSKNPEATGNVPAMFTNQIALLKGSNGTFTPLLSKCVAIFEYGLTPGGTSVADALACYNGVLKYGMAGVWNWRDGATLGGASSRTTVQKQYALDFGVSPPP